MAGSAQTEVRQHNALNQITRLQNPAATDPLISPTYDGSGNLTNDGTLGYTWDALNRLVAAGSSAHYVYDALDRRIRKTVSGVVTDCLYSGWQCVEDRDVSNNPSVQYVWGIYLDELVQQKNVAALNNFGTNAVLYPLQDLLYRTTGLADSAGVIGEAYDFDAYGATLVFRNTSGGVVTPITFTDADTQVTSPTCPFLLTGQRYDAETGLYYYKRHYYSPALGRFLSRDPIGHLASDNLYEYLRDQSKNETAATGLRLLSPYDAFAVGSNAIQGDDVSLREPLGKTDCDLAKPVGSPLTITNVNSTCTRVCTQKHEEQHARDMAPCCDKARKTLSQFKTEAGDPPSLDRVGSEA